MAHKPSRDAEKTCTRAMFSMEHERDHEREEIGFQMKWKVSQ